MLFICGIIYGSFLEWTVHKHLFHKRGKNKNSIFSFHLGEHHLNCLNNENYDVKFTWRENLGILLLAVLHLPILFFSAILYYGIVSYAIAFIIVHKFVHKYVNWGKTWFPWHWEHHMKYQNHNMNVVLPIADYILRTRKREITSDNK